MPRKPHNLITDICGHLRICRKSASVRKCPDPCSGQTRRHSGTVQLRTDYCGQLREKYATVHTHVGNFFFFLGGGAVARINGRLVTTPEPSIRIDGSGPHCLVGMEFFRRFVRIRHTMRQKINKIFWGGVKPLSRFYPRHFRSFSRSILADALAARREGWTPAWMLWPIPLTFFAKFACMYKDADFFSAAACGILRRAA